MSSRPITLLSSVLAIGAAAAALLAPTGATAGQFKTLNTENLGAGQSLQATSSPKNTGNAMEMEVYEFQTATGGGTYRCNILANATGQTLTIRQIAVNGAQGQGQFCSAPPAGTCSTPGANLVGNLKFFCLVATGNNQPVVGVNPTYRISVSRQ